MPLALQKFLFLMLAHLLAAFFDDATHVIPSRIRSKCDGTDTRNLYNRQPLRDDSIGFLLSSCSAEAKAEFLLPYKRR